MAMHQRTDAHGGGAFGTHERLRQANSEKLQALLHRTAAAGGVPRRGRNSALLTGDYLDFENAEFGNKWINLGWGLMVVVALFLLYVMWFTDWVR
ncbi:hypothetical protein LSCM4_06481 [Leishmania orientalis]|uniref:Uncharacterized protein n=1 Tax=Leishmania orientalis TaxID=2249476 RepID=A0A836HMV8_9TRYP|nr:hypothetical protein LSCM4_06481 [Leishmania orientalis]